MADTMTLKEAVEARGPYAVWDLMDEDEQRTAAATLWTEADRETRTALELALAKEMKFRPQSVRRLPAEQVASRLKKMADTLPDTVLFQFLFHLHMAHRRSLLVAYLDSVGLPHDNGVLDLPEDFGEPDANAVGSAGEALVEEHGHQALVYLATLKVADTDLWKGLDSVLDAYDESGVPVEKAGTGGKK